MVSWKSHHVPPYTSLDFGASGEHVEVAETQEYEGDPAFGTATTQLHRVHVERGMSFSEAVAKLNDGGVLPGEGFYVSKKVNLGTYSGLILSLPLYFSVSYQCVSFSANIGWK